VLNIVEKIVPQGKCSDFNLP